MVPLVTVLAVVLVSLIVTRVATVALILTGLSRETARFQARSALSGAGFTTSESEKVVNHPVRRRIIQTLMLLGSAGLAAAIASLAISFGGGNLDQRFQRGTVLVVGLFGIWRLSLSTWVDRRLSSLIAWFLERRGFQVRDHVSLLELAGEYEVSELGVREGDWLAGRSLGELRLHDEGILVLGIYRPDGSYVAIPQADTCIAPDDTLVLYGHGRRTAELDERQLGPSGDSAHRQAAVR